MIAKDLISNTLKPLRPSDTGDRALQIMADYNIRHLPVVKNEVLLGLVQEEDILDADPDLVVGSYEFPTFKIVAKANDHVFEVMELMSKYSLSVIPVVQAENHYIGMVTQEDLVNFFGKSFSIIEPGGIIVLELMRRDYAMTEISRIVESEGALILSSFITTDPLDINTILVTIKVNTMDIHHIVATFERFSYQVRASFTESEQEDLLKERYDSLMAYLKV
ncbi:MAG: CBS domain-containing protein [Saprospiraceae bacterium]